MKGPTLQKTAALSAALHLTVLILSLLMLRQSNRFIAPSPYIVDLVSPAAISRNDTGGSAQTFTKAVTPLPKVESKPAKERKDDKPDKKTVENALTELKAKKNIERIVRLRSIISLKGKSEPSSQSAVSKNTAGSGTKGADVMFESYYARITREIWQEWICPDFGAKDLEAIIFVKIARDGTITVQGIEKSSGDAIFDRSGLKAIAKASPVSPPPYEMEIGIRFYP